eukprot:233332-Prymnesium_polylepis.1
MAPGAASSVASATSTLLPAGPAPARIAHCISGGVRGFPDPEMSGWLSNFVKALSDPFKPDVFMYLAANQTSMDNVTNKFTAHDLDLAISRLDPIVVEFERTEPPASSHFTTKCTTSSGKGPVCSTGAEQVCAYHGQMDKVARSFELAKRHEQRFGFRYEYFTRLRPDVYFEVRLRVRPPSPPLARRLTLGALRQTCAAV